MFVVSDGVDEWEMFQRQKFPCEVDDDLQTCTFSPPCSGMVPHCCPHILSNDSEQYILILQSHI